MLNWHQDPEDASVFRQWKPWFEGVLTSGTFQPSTTKQQCSPTPIAELPRHVQQAVDDSYIYYRQMYELRLRSDVP